MRLASHLTVAAGAFVVIMLVTDKALMLTPYDLFLAGFSVLLGCCLPDIDHPGSTVGRRFTILSYPIRLIFGHRGITHSLVAIVALYLISAHLQSFFMYWLTLGYALHLVGDFLTDAGIPLFYPIKRRCRFVLVGSTGSVSEYVIVGIFLLACFYFVNVFYQF